MATDGDSLVRMDWPWRKPAPTPPPQERLPSDVVDTLFQEAVRPLAKPSGLIPVSARRWVRGRHAPIRHVFEVQAMKGRSYSPRWYLSLDFVPHVVAGRLAYHRTDKSARPDLVFDPWDYAASTEPAALRPWQVSSSGSLEDVTVAATDMAEWAVPRAEAWFSETTKVEDLPDAFERSASLPVRRFGLDNYVQPRLAWAFSLAAAGDTPAAHRQLDAWLLKGGRGLPADLTDEVRRRLDAMETS